MPLSQQKKEDHRTTLRQKLTICPDLQFRDLGPNSYNQNVILCSVFFYYGDNIFIVVCSVFLNVERGVGN